MHLRCRRASCPLPRGGCLLLCDAVHLPRARLPSVTPRYTDRHMAVTGRHDDVLQKAWSAIGGTAEYAVSRRFSPSDKGREARAYQCADLTLAESRPTTGS
jgi:hypothetical protein